MPTTVEYAEAWTTAQRDAALRALHRHGQLADGAASQGVLPYLYHLVIDSTPVPALYRDVAEPWQWALASRVAPALEDLYRPVQGNCRYVPPRYEPRPSTYAGPRRFWFTLPRGHDKTSAIGRLISWGLGYGKQARRAIAAAADRDQAAFITEFMQREAALNPWLHRRLGFRNWHVSGFSGSHLNVLSADEFSSYGLKEDLIVLDELTHWPTPGLFHSIVTGLVKRPQAVLIIITNAGLRKTWQHAAFLEAKASPLWFVYESPGQIAHWMDARQIDEARRMVPPGIARRLFDNLWTDPGEELGFVTRAEALACCDPGLARREVGVASDAPYVASIDYGPVKDRTVCCVGHQEPFDAAHPGGGRVVLDRMDVWEGRQFPSGRVPVALVDAWIEEVAGAYPGVSFTVDAHELEATLQKYEGRYEISRFAYRGGKGNFELASNLRALVISRKFAYYPGAGDLPDPKAGTIQGLADELAEVVIRPMSYGFRVSHELTAHDDRVVCIGMMALALVRQAGAREIVLTERYF